MGRPVTIDKIKISFFSLSNLSPSLRNYKLSFTPYTNSIFQLSYDGVASTNIFSFSLPLPLNLALFSFSLIVTESEIKSYLFFFEDSVFFFNFDFGLSSFQEARKGFQEGVDF
ncbi:hypothetical protein N665_0502s0033 [Sinapis alba]|nr:hypothetical protein N665_0502s0033 [Sinapis alba]